MISIFRRGKSGQAGNGTLAAMGYIKQERTRGRSRRTVGRSGGQCKALWIAAVAAAGLLMLAVGAAAQNGFDDASGTHEPAINALASEGILEGTECGERRICPDDPLLRWVMGVWLVRAAAESPSTAASRFTDLDPAVWWTPYVERLAELDITQGCSTSPARYCPDQPVTRGQMATFLTRAFDLEDGPSAGFTDADGHRHAEAIDALAAARITTGCGENRYCPDAVVTRGQMATFLARSLDLADRPETTTLDFNPLGFTAIAAGNEHSCGIRTNSTVICWGGNQYGQADPPTGQFTDITAYLGHSCGLRTNGTIICWGYNEYGQTEAPTGQFTTITTGAYHSCGIRTDHTVTCWGSNKFGQTETPTGQFTTITAGGEHSCGIRTDHTVSCWGRNHYGQTSAPSTEKLTAITTGWRYSCGIRTDRTLTCWGEIDAPAGQFTSITTGLHHSCGIRTNRTLTCWGNNYYNQADTPTGPFIAFAIGAGHSCGIHTDNTVTCWGGDHLGQATPPTITGQFTIITESCGIRTDRTVACWNGQIPSPSTEKFTAISTGAEHSCGIRTDGTVTCWVATGTSRHTHQLDNSPRS